MKEFLRYVYHKSHHTLRTNWKEFYLYYAVVLLALVTLIQLIYPSNHLVLFTTIDGVEVGGWDKQDATAQIDSRYANQVISVYFGASEKSYFTLLPAEVGVSTSNEARINSLDYPWYLRIVPTSILWAHIFNDTSSQPVYQRNNEVLTAYIGKNIGKTCNMPFVDASIRVVDSNLVVQSSKIGVVCDINDVKNYFATVTPNLTQNSSIRIAAAETMPTITDEVATSLFDKIKKSTDNGITLKSEDSLTVIPASVIYSWLDFNVSNNQINYSLNEARASEYLSKEYISLLSSDYQSIISSSTIETGSTQVNIINSQLNIGATLANIKSVVDGDGVQAVVVVAVANANTADSLINAKQDAAFASVLSRYTQSHQGTYGVSLIELSNLGRRADYNGGRIFTTASTYKLFVAYSTLLRVESGVWHWSDNVVDGRDLSTCFDDMIVNSDNDCGAVMLDRVGYQNITNEAAAIGCSSTSFIGNDGIKTTANDLALLLAKLQTGQILTLQSSRDLLINAMKNNVYRDGIPTGISNSVVADKVGFMDNLLHDASIVYGPSGNYILVIMTENSSWQTIADFAGQIEAYHAK